MASTLLGHDAQQSLLAKKKASAKHDTTPRSRMRRGVRAFLIFMVGLLSLGTVGTAFAAQAAITDVPENIASTVVNMCNPNAVVTYPRTPSKESGIENPDDPMYATFNPYVAETAAANEGSTTAMRKWIGFIRHGNDDSNLDGASATWPVYGTTGVMWTSDETPNATDLTDLPDSNSIFAQSGPGLPAETSVPGYSTGPTVALRELYNRDVGDSDTYKAVIVPQYERYGFDTLQWTNYGSSCFSIGHWLTPFMNILLKFMVHAPMSLSFILLKLALEVQVANLFYIFIYPLSALMAKLFTPLLAVIAIAIGLPYAWIKSKGSLQKLLSSSLWIAAMLTLALQFTDSAKARRFTEFAQGSVIMLSGTLACTVANNTYANFALRESKDYGLGGPTDSTPDPTQDIESFDTSDGFIDRAVGEFRVGARTTVSTDTECGSYLNGVYQAFWQGVPLQTWAEGQVGYRQASLDRASQGDGKIGWYQAHLNGLYYNTEDAEGQATERVISLWNSAGYAKASNTKPYLWDGSAQEPQQTTLLNAAATSNAKLMGGDGPSPGGVAPWRFVPFLLNVKIMCKDDNPGSNEPGQEFVFNYSADSTDPQRNKWLYEGSCILGSDGDMISAVQGNNIGEKAASLFVGHMMSAMITLATFVVAGYLLVQKFIWGWMLIFAPVFIGIAAFPDKKRMQFAQKYLEFCVANVVKQVIAVITLVIMVTAMNYIIYPPSGVGFVVLPAIVKPLLVAFFVLSAVLFAIPLKRILTGAVKGDAAVVNKTADTGKTVLKTGAAVSTATVGGAAAVGYMKSARGSAAMGRVAHKAAAFTSAHADSIAKASKVARTGARAAHVGGHHKSARLMSLGGYALQPAASFAENWSNTVTANPEGNGLSSLQSAMGLRWGEAGKLTTAKDMQAYAELENAKAKAGDLPKIYDVDKDGLLTADGKKKVAEDMRAGKLRDKKIAHIANPALLRREEADVKRSLIQGGMDEASAEQLAHDQVYGQAENRINREAAARAALLQSNPSRYTDENGVITQQHDELLIEDARQADGALTDQANRVVAHALRKEDKDGKYSAIAKRYGEPAALHAATLDAQEVNFGTNGTFGRKYVSQLQDFELGRTVMVASGTPTLEGNADQMVSSIDASREYLDASGAGASPMLLQSIEAYKASVQDYGADSPEARVAHSGVLHQAHLDSPAMVSPQTKALHELADIAQNTLPMQVTRDEIENYREVFESDETPGARAALEYLDRVEGARSGRKFSQNEQGAYAEALRGYYEMNREDAYMDFSRTLPLPQYPDSANTEQARHERVFDVREEYSPPSEVLRPSPSAPSAEQPISSEQVREYLHPERMEPKVLTVPVATPDAPPSKNRNEPMDTPETPSIHIPDEAPSGEQVVSNAHLDDEVRREAQRAHYAKLIAKSNDEIETLSAVLEGDVKRLKEFNERLATADESQARALNEEIDKLRAATSKNVHLLQAETDRANELRREIENL